MHVLRRRAWFSSHFTLKQIIDLNQSSKTEYVLCVMVRLGPENVVFFAFSEKSVLKGELREFEALLERLHKMKNESMQNLHQF